MPFAPMPEQCREPLAADHRQPKFGRIALGDVLNCVHPKVCVGKRRVDLGRLLPQILTAATPPKALTSMVRGGLVMSATPPPPRVSARPACRPF